jgi:hypothetical protein
MNIPCCATFLKPNRRDEEQRRPATGLTLQRQKLTRQKLFTSIIRQTTFTLNVNIPVRSKRFTSIAGMLRATSSMNYEVIFVTSERTTLLTK